MTSRLSSSGDGEKIKRTSQSDVKQGGLREYDPLNRARKDVIKVALEAPNLPTQLYEINQKLSLKENILNFCQRWNLPDADDYEFLHIDSQLYITESTREAIKNGDVLRLATSPKKLAESLMAKLTRKNASEKRVDAFEQLAKSSSDPTFASEFIKNQGLKWLIAITENGGCQKIELAFALAAFLELMDHGLALWDSIVTTKYIQTIAGFVNKGSEDKVLQHALGIMEYAVVNSVYHYYEIEGSLDVDNLVAHLHRSNSEVQQGTIALLNSLFMKAPHDGENRGGRQKISELLAQKHFRTVILNNVIRTPKNIESEMAHQLHVLQILMFNTLEEQMLTRFDLTSSQDVNKLLELSTIACDNTQQGIPAVKRAHTHTTFNPVDYKKLGFVNYNNPNMDFMQTPPGILSLDAMVYFARNQQDNYIRLILENSSRDDMHVCPFGKSSIEITKMLCEILKIGEQPTELGEDFYPMFFTHDHAFEEFYCICVQLFNKTWKEMSAIKDDFEKVLSVVHDQIVLTLKTRPSSLDAFKQKLSNYSYSEILKKREQEWVDKDKDDSQATPVVELQREIRPTIIELIRDQRYAFMKEGTLFHGLQKKKSKWYCRLSPNLKVLHYGDVGSSEKSYSIDALQHELTVSDIKSLAVGKNCPHIKNSKAQKSTTDLAFSILYEPDKSLNFVASSVEIWSMWVDGINCLLGKKMLSPQAKSDMELLLTMEMKLRLLDLENIPIPDQPPKIPPLPTNYDFAS